MTIEVSTIREQLYLPYGLALPEVRSITERRKQFLIESPEFQSHGSIGAVIDFSASNTPDI